MPILIGWTLASWQIGGMLMCIPMLACFPFELYP